MNYQGPLRELELELTGTLSTKIEVHCTVLGNWNLSTKFQVILILCRFVRSNPDYERRYSLPRHFGLFYALGTALMMEGVCSACYHVCPSHTNFQFDTAFMYTISVLILVKIFQSRHPDINANAYTAFGVLALCILLGMLGVVKGTLGFWITFIALHVASCLALSLQIYYMGRWRMNPGIFR